MAPSPTGDYHIGHIRTLLYNYAFARKNKGEFIIRIEDTDRERFIDGAIDRILDVISDFGFDWDEGPRVGGKFGPYLQSERLPIYKEYAEKLVKLGHAYYCFCTKERLSELKAEQERKGYPVTKYDKHCLSLTDEKIAENLKNNLPYVIRQKVPEDREIKLKDEILGEVKFQTKDIEDGVLLKSDGFPVYHLAVVVDDYLMGITHVLRGVDWLPSTPKHLLIYEALNWEPPKYAHLPNLKEVGGSQKLSKRFGAVFAHSFLEEGYLVPALVNFVMLLGWNPGDEREVFSLQEFIKEFSLERIHKTDLVAFDREKLLWMNGYYIRSMSLEALYDALLDWSKKFNVNLDVEGYSKEYVKKCLELVKDRMRKLNDFTDLTSYFFAPPIVNRELSERYIKDPSVRDKLLSEFYKLYTDIDSGKWGKDNLDKLSHELILDLGLKPKEAFMTLRIICLGKEATPPLFDVLHTLGKRTVLERIKSFI